MKQRRREPSESTGRILRDSHVQDVEAGLSVQHTPRPAISSERDQDARFFSKVRMRPSIAASTTGQCSCRQVHPLGDDEVCFEFTGHTKER